MNKKLVDIVVSSMALIGSIACSSSYAAPTIINTPTPPPVPSPTSMLKPEPNSNFRSLENNIYGFKYLNFRLKNDNLVGNVMIFYDTDSDPYPDFLFYHELKYDPNKNFTYISPVIFYIDINFVQEGVREVFH